MAWLPREDLSTAMINLKQEVPEVGDEVTWVDCQCGLPGVALIRFKSGKLLAVHVERGQELAQSQEGKGAGPHSSLAGTGGDPSST